MEKDLITKSKRPGMNTSIDVFYEQTDGIPHKINDKTCYKIILVNGGSFVIEDEGKYRLVTAPSVLGLNESSELKVVSERGVKTRTVFFRPSIIREEFSVDNIKSGKYDKFISAVKSDKEMTAEDRLVQAIDGDIQFEDAFSNSMIYQDVLYLLEFFCYDKNIVYYSLSRQEYDTLRRLFISIKYEINEQPDNLWILRTRYFIISILFLAVDFYRNDRQDDIYKDPLVAKVARYFWDYMDEDISLSTVLKQFSVNKNTLNEAFYNEVSMSCMAYLEQMRINIAKKYLQFSEYSISEISTMCGYSDTNYFSKVFKKHTGMTASEFQKSTREDDQ